MKKIATGNKAVAEAVKQAKPEVIAAYPITPQTEIVEQIAEFVSSGELASRYIPVESEHSAMAACIGASITGVRTFTATSSHGLLYMHEMTNWAAGARLPIVMANVNRSIGPGWNIWAEHTDSLQERDTGWLQVYVSTVQEAYDATLMAFRIAEHNDVLLPVMVNLDGFSLSHIMQPLDTVELGDFIPPDRTCRMRSIRRTRRLWRAHRAGTALQIPVGDRALDAGLGRGDRRDRGGFCETFRQEIRVHRGLPVRGCGRHPHRDGNARQGSRSRHRYPAVRKGSRRDRCASAGSAPSRNST